MHSLYITALLAVTAIALPLPTEANMPDLSHSARVTWPPSAYQPGTKQNLPNQLSPISLMTETYSATDLCGRYWKGHCVLFGLLLQLL